MKDIKRPRKSTPELGSVEPFFSGTPTRNKGGRPPKSIAPAQLATVKALAARGVRERDIGRAFEIAPTTWLKLKKERPDVQEAFDAGRQIMHDALVGKLFERAMKGDLVPNLFLLKCVFHYREQGDESGETRPQITINMQGSLTPEAWRERIAEHRAIELKAPPKVTRG
jgi:hypothetical protein